MIGSVCLCTAILGGVVPAFFPPQVEFGRAEYEYIAPSENERRERPDFDTLAQEVSREKLDVYLSVLTWTYECTRDCQMAERLNEEYKRIDSNGKYSYGCLQFQEQTWFAMTKKYNVDPFENGGIYNCDQQWKVARAMFTEDPVGASMHWKTSIYDRGLGLPDAL